MIRMGGAPGADTGRGPIWECAGKILHRNPPQALGAPKIGELRSQSAASCAVPTTSGVGGESKQLMAYRAFKKLLGSSGFCSP